MGVFVKLGPEERPIHLLKIGGAEATTDPLESLARRQLFESSMEKLGTKLEIEQLNLGLDAVAIISAVAQHGDASLRNGP